MIRLDGNSLAAFRGAGVAGTVQSVAGCELFGAARGTSPYSAAATAYLEENYPDYLEWAKQYGFDHPEVVPYVNANPNWLFYDRYVSDGLLLQIDGINRGNVAGKWIDLIGNREFTFNDAEKCILTNDSVRFQNGGYAYYSSALQLATSTIEAVVRCSANNGCVYDSGRTDSYLRWDAAIYYAPTCSKCWTRPETQLVGTIQVTTSKCIENGVSLSSRGGNTSHTNDVATIGRARGGTWYAYHNGEICALRIYNRVLTDDELAANRQWDIKRFELIESPA